MIRRWLEQVLGVSALDRIAADASRRSSANESVFTHVQRALGFKVDISDDDISRIPQDGPLIVVANHPTGARDGILAAALFERFRPAVKSLAHVWFQRWPTVAERMILVDPQHASGDSDRTNRKAMVDATRWLRDGNTLIVFPGARVAGWDWRRCHPVEPRWKAGVALLAKASGATVLPVHLSGHNSLLYRLLDLIHGRLAAIHLARETLNKRGSRVRVTVGEPLSTSELLANGADPDEVVAGLRQRVIDLGDNAHADEILSADDSVLESDLSTPTNGRSGIGAGHSVQLAVGVSGHGVRGGCVGG